MLAREWLLPGGRQPVIPGIRRDEFL